MYNANELTGFTLTRLNGVPETYYYRRNLQGDITHIYTQTGMLVAEYAYDAWGNHKVITNINDIATINPFRYRGYYFDQEIGLYYLKSRYYDPKTGRFINADMISILNESKNMVNGLNLFMYCGNNPVMRTDESGRKWWKWLIGGAIVATLIVAAVAVTVLSAGAASPLVAVLGATGAGILKGVIIGAAVGATLNAGISVGVAAWKGEDLADAFMWGAISGAASGAISGIPGLGYLGTFITGGIGAVVGAGISGSLDFSNPLSALLSIGGTFVIGGLANMAGKFIGDKIAKTIQNHALKEVLHWSNDLVLGDLVNGANKGMAKALMNSLGSFSRSWIYSLTTSGISAILSAKWS